MPQAHPTGNNRNPMHGVHLFKKVCNNCVSSFVIGGKFFVFITLKPLFGRPEFNLGCTFLKISHRDLVIISSCSANCGLVKHVFKVGSRKTHGSIGNLAPIYSFCKFLSPGMDMKNSKPSFFIRHIKNNSSIKSSWSKKCWVKQIPSISGRNNNHVIVGGKAVHFNQNLIEGLFSLVMPAHEALSPLASDCVDFINKNNRRGRSFGLSEKITGT